MTIRNEIDVELWEALEKNYESENYKSAILDAIFKLTETIRNKTGLEGDGSALIGQAFGGNDPQIKLNKLQTDSEKDIQKGIQDILRGIYTGIRNPRSHDAMVDDKLSADAIIVFINYLLKLIDQSKLRFSETDFLERVFDPYYVKTEEYSDLLVQEIPKRQRANIAIQVILQHKRGDIYALGFFFKSLLKQLEPFEVSRTCKVIDGELRATQDQADIRYILHMCPGGLWLQLDKTVRIRTENILYEDFSKGAFDVSSGLCGKCGALATWITEDHLINFDKIEKWTRQAVEMLQSDSSATTAYISNFFWYKICHVNKESITWPLEHYFDKGLEDHDQEVIEQMKNQIVWDKDHPWWAVFEEELKEYPDIKYEELPF